MGHAHYSTTIDIYTQVTKEKFKLEVSKFQEIGSVYETLNSLDETDKDDDIRPPRNLGRKELERCIKML